jgi:hypothetical protein
MKFLRAFVLKISFASGTLHWVWVVNFIHGIRHSFEPARRCALPCPSTRASPPTMGATGWADGHHTLILLHENSQNALQI